MSRKSVGARSKLAALMAVGVLCTGVSFSGATVGVASAETVEPAPVEPAPVEPMPVDPAPSEPVETDVVPSEPGTTTPEPSDPAPTDPAPSGPEVTSEPTPAEPTASPTPDASTPATPGPTEPGDASTTPTQPEFAPQYDLGDVDFVNDDDLAGVGDDAADLTERARAQLDLIEKALKEAQERVDKAGKEYDKVRREADEARSELKELEDEIALAREEAEVSDQVVNLMVQGMRQGTYSVPPEFNIVLEGGDQMLYRYGVVSSLTVDRVRVSESAREAAEKLESLLPEAEKARENAERAEEVAEGAKRDAVEAQEWLNDQLEAAETNADVLMRVLEELGYEGDLGSGELQTLLEVRNSLREMESVEVRDGQVASPMPNSRITSSFGFRTTPIHGMHWGTDYVNGNTCGTPLYAMASGTVTFAGTLGGYGGHLEIDAGNGIVYSYSHLQPNGVGVRVGEKVRAGQPVALAGTTGRSTGCHLHLEITVNGKHVNPEEWLRAQGIG